MVRGITIKYFKYPSTSLCLVYLLLLTILNIVSVYQLVHIYMAPGIEPGNLIRSTLIRSPPGSFLLKLSNMVTDVTEENTVKNIVIRLQT